MSHPAGSQDPVILFCCAVWPEPESSAAGVRVQFMIESIRRLRPEWRLVVHSGALPNAAMERLRSESGIECMSIPANDARFDAWVGGLKPDIVLFERFYTEEQFGWRVREHAPAALSVLDTSDLHFLRQLREAGVRVANVDDIIRRPLVEDSRRVLHRELASILRCDRTWVVSRFELALLSALPDFPAQRVALLRWGVEPLEDAPDFPERRHFVTIGNFRHPPNRDSVLRLRRDIWPEIRRHRPDLELHVHGSYPAGRDMELHDPRSGFHMKGPWAGDVRTLLSRYRVLLSPLRFGAGIKGKILDAWASGTPVITSDIGAEGMVEGDFPGVVLESGTAAVNWAGHAVEIHDSEERFRLLAHHARLALASEFDSEVNACGLMDELESLLGERSCSGERRHWLSELLHSEDRHASRALSKYIELKQRLIAGS
jgi:glycosyltransferase involved in cell wall biosynthesis